MRSSVFTLVSVVVLAGCGGPLDRLGSFSDVEMAEDAGEPVSLAAPEPETRAGLFSIFRGGAEYIRPQARSVPPAERPAESAAPAPETADAPKDTTGSTPRRGLFAFLRPKPDPEPSTENVDETVEEATSDTAEAAPTQTPEITPEIRPERRGLLAMLRQSRDTHQKRAWPRVPVQLASLNVEDTPTAPDAARPEPLATPAPKPRGIGLFGLALGPKSVARRGGQEPEVAHKTRLPFGEVARVCEATHKNKGRIVERHKSGYVLHDTKPGDDAQRTFYVTGFKDGCPRQFTAALALFGAPAMHEQLRYGRPAETYPYSETDREYERVKSAVCSVGRRKPCGSKIRVLERNTVFISTYENFKDNGQWADILIHNGTVLASAIKAP